MMKLPVEERLQRARLSLILAEPFFGSLVMYLKFIGTTAVPTCATNGALFVYNEEYVQSQNDDELRGLIVHEIMHCALGHPFRRNQREYRKWNRACDHAVNLFIEAYNEDQRRAGSPGSGNIHIFKLPKGACADAQFKDKSAEEIYSMLPDEPPDKNKLPGNASSIGEVNDATDQDGGEASKEERSEQEQDWKQNTQSAATAAQQRGNKSASIAKLLGDLLEPRPDWRERLRRFVMEKSNDDYSWQRPNRRYSGDFILPGLHSERMGHLAIGWDTSGSIFCSPAMLEQFCSELLSIIDSAKPSKVTIIECDAEIQRVYELFPGDQLDSKSVKGGGGTSFVPVFKHVDEMADRPVALIYLTDLEGEFPKHAPDYPVLWAATTDHDIPFGERIKIELL